MTLFLPPRTTTLLFFDIYSDCVTFFAAKDNDVPRRTIAVDNDDRDDDDVDGACGGGVSVSVRAVELEVTEPAPA